MRERTVHITGRCNLACAACEHRGGGQPSPAALREAVAAAAAQRPERLYLTGGEPLLLRRLPALVALARARGAGLVVVDTNGLLCADARVLRPLVAAGLGAARLFLPAGDAAGWERFTGLAGGFASVLQGIANLRAAGVALSLRHPVVPGTEEALPGVVAFAARLGAAGLGAAPVEVLVDVRPAPGAADLARWAPHFAAAAEAAAGAGVALRFLPGREPRGGVLPTGTAPAPAPAGGAPPAPVAAADVFSVFYEYDDDDDGGGGGGTARLALTYRCDQACGMCELGRVAGAPSDEALALALEAAAERGVRRLVLTGGEPTLDPRLPDVVRRARALGLGEVELQTNAVRLAHGDLAARLAAAGLGRAFVSLHAADAATSDALTGAPGTHARTLAGVDRLLAAGVTVDVNCVVGPQNLAGLAALVDRVHERWGAHPQFDRIHFHTVRGDPHDPERWRPHVAPLSLVGPALRQALERCRALGLRFTGPGSAMGVPWCVLDGEPRWLGPLAGPGAPRLHREERGLFTRVAACAGCRLEDRCPGVRADYVAVHGADGVRRL